MGNRAQWRKGLNDRRANTGAGVHGKGSFKAILITDDDDSRRKRPCKIGSLAARLIYDQPGSSVTTTENHVAKPPLYTMILVPIAVRDCPLHCYVFGI